MTRENADLLVHVRNTYKYHRISVTVRDDNKLDIRLIFAPEEYNESMGSISKWFDTMQYFLFTEEIE